MKKHFLTFFVILITSTLFAQNPQQEGVPKASLEHDYSSASYIDLDGNVIKGEILYNEYDNNFWYRKSNNDKGVKFNAKQVKSFTLEKENLTFYAKAPYFYKKKNKETKIEIFERFVPKHNALGAVIISGGNIMGKYQLFVSIKDKLDITLMNNLSITPFHKKVPPLLDKCPELSQKVAKKEKGYKKNMFNAYFVWSRIAEEYEKCAN